MSPYQFKKHILLKGGIRTPSRKIRHNLSNTRIGQLSVFSLVGLDRFKRTWWKCKCDCGRPCFADGHNLLIGRTKSCGCFGANKTKLKPGQNTENILFHDKNKQAARRGIEFALGKESFISLIKRNCFYCNRPPSQTRLLPSPHGRMLYNGIDRIDSAKGYIDGNCVPCCKFCNSAKNTLSVKQFIELISNIHNNRDNILKLAI